MILVARVKPREVFTAIYPEISAQMKNLLGAANYNTASIGGLVDWRF
mgnify:FL=1